MSENAIRSLARGTEPTYKAYLDRFRHRFLQLVTTGRPLFRTTAGPLFNLYLEKIADPTERQESTCNSCRDFVDRYGDLVFLDDEGVQVSAFWSSLLAPDVYKAAHDELQDRVENALVTSVFVSDVKVLGRPVTGEWCHMAVQLPANLVHSKIVPTAYQEEAEKTTDFETTEKLVKELKHETLIRALALFHAGKLPMKEKFLPTLNWLIRIHDLYHGLRGGQPNAYRRSRNVLWYAVATSPRGLCRIRAGALGSLLDDVAEGMGDDAVIRRFAVMVAPDQYLRPQAAPDVGTIRQAEEIIAKLGLRRSFDRRFAKVEDVRQFWKPPVAVEPKLSATGGMFSHLLPTAAPSLGSPVQAVSAMTWVKFRDTVLPRAQKIEYVVPPSYSIGNYIGFTTAVNADAPPILRWDDANDRYPVSHYVISHGSPPERWNVKPNTFCEVIGIVAPEGQRDSIAFLLKDAKDLKNKGAGSAIFPENMLHELHGIRSVIEAHSKSVDLFDEGGPYAAGIAISSTLTAQMRVAFRVTSVDGTIIDYKLDRWD